MTVDASLLTTQTVTDSVVQATMICGMLGFLIWNVKLCFEDVK